MALARAAAEARQAYLLRKAATDRARLDAAQKAHQEGDIRVACRIYVSLATSRSGDAASREARKRLEQLAAEAKKKLREIDAELSQGQGELSPGETSFDASRAELVRSAFRKYDQLAEEYGAVPEVRRELESHVGKKRRQPEYAQILAEPRAKALWDLAEQHEQEDNSCCAYWVYQEAAKLVPAPSARRAQNRLAEMDRNPQIMAAAKACRELQECHKLYRSAQRIAPTDPGRAKGLFAQIIARAPVDSELYRAAQTSLGDLP